MTRPYRLAILAYYPMAFQSAFFRAISAREEVDLTVYYLIGAELDSERRNADFRANTRPSPRLLEGYHYEALANYSPVQSLSSPLRFLNPHLVARLITRPLDAILISGWNFLPQMLLANIPTPFRPPFLLRTDTNGFTATNRSSGRLASTIRSSVVHNASAILYTSSANRAYYEKAGIPSNKLFSSPFAVDNEAVSSQYRIWSARCQETKRAIGITNDAPVLMYAGKLIAWKRPELVLQGAAPLLRKQLINLVFVGDGESRSKLEAFVTSESLPNVFFTGFVPNAEVPRFLAASDILALLSPEEPFGLIVNEAMLCHNALLLSNTCGCAADLVRDNVNGRTIKSESPDEVTGALVSLLEDPSRLAQFGNASASLIQDWSPNHAADGLVEALRFVRNPTHIGL